MTSSTTAPPPADSAPLADPHCCRPTLHRRRLTLRHQLIPHRHQLIPHRHQLIPHRHRLIPHRHRLTLRRRLTPRRRADPTPLPTAPAPPPPVNPAPPPDRRGAIYAVLAAFAAPITFAPPWDFLTPAADCFQPIGDPAAAEQQLRGAFTETELCAADVLVADGHGGLQIHPRLTAKDRPFVLLRNATGNVVDALDGLWLPESSDPAVLTHQRPDLPVGPRCPRPQRAARLLDVGLLPAAGPGRGGCPGHASGHAQPARPPLAVQPHQPQRGRVQGPGAGSRFRGPTHVDDRRRRLARVPGCHPRRAAGAGHALRAGGEAPRAGLWRCRCLVAAAWGIEVSARPARCRNNCVTTSAAARTCISCRRFASRPARPARSARGSSCARPSRSSWPPAGAPPTKSPTRPRP